VVLLHARRVRMRRSAIIGVALLIAGCASGRSSPSTVPTLGATGQAAPADGSVPPPGTTAPIAPPPDAGTRAPGFFGQFLDGTALSTETAAGRPVILNFWLTTCEPCIRELPALAGAAREHDGLLVIGVNYEEGASAIEAFLDGFEPRPEFPILLDTNGELARAYQVVVFPTTFFIDADGVIRYRRNGEVRSEHLVVGLERIGIHP
jgi:cytochrome c biogenesis protein CcmG/thiol:disulfide interchange protein DsbE